MTSTPHSADAAVPDIDALRAKYAQERDKRLRSDGEQQYVEVIGEFAAFYETDPWSDPIDRGPITEEIDLIILGGGFAGLLAGARVRERGIEDFRIIEMGGDFGGTWYWNRYPGVQCDIESYCYLPLLDELGYVPRQRYSSGAEILEHCQRIGRHFGLYEKALFQTMVRTMRWDEEASRWRVVTDRGDEIAARHLIVALGAYNRPKLPGIPGVQDFAGHMFHTSRWDYAYTGGDSTGGLDELSDKRIAVIGTGATGIQVIPHLARHAEHLYVFQRTPSVVAPRNNSVTDPEWAASRPAGWARARRANFNEMITVGLEDDQVGDGWTAINRRVVAQRHEGMTADDIAALREVEDYRHMEALRRRVDELVENAETAEKLKAWYRWNCKRPTFHDEYLQTYNRDNVTLVDVSSTKGVERTTERGIRTGGVEYPVDAIVFASGFEITSELHRRYGIDAIDGRNGLSLYDHWKDGYRTLHGFTTDAFPNLFFVGQYQGGVSANITSMYDDQSRHIAYIIGEALRRGVRAVEPSVEAVDEWVSTIRALAVDREKFYAECTPGYYNNEAGPIRRSHIGEAYSPGITAFNELLGDWRARGDMAGLVLSA